MKIRLFKKDFTLMRKITLDHFITNGHFAVDKNLVSNPEIFEGKNKIINNFSLSIKPIRLKEKFTGEIEMIPIDFIEEEIINGQNLSVFKSKFGNKRYYFNSRYIKMLKLKSGLFCQSALVSENFDRIIMSMII